MAQQPWPCHAVTLFVLFKAVMIYIRLLAIYKEPLKETYILTKPAEPRHALDMPFYISEEVSGVGRLITGFFSRTCL